MWCKCHVNLPIWSQLTTNWCGVNDHVPISCKCHVNLSSHFGSQLDVVWMLCKCHNKIFPSLIPVDVVLMSCKSYLSTFDPFHYWWPQAEAVEIHRSSLLLITLPFSFSSLHFYDLGIIWCRNELCM